MIAVFQIELKAEPTVKSVFATEFDTDMSVEELKVSYVPNVERLMGVTVTEIDKVSPDDEPLVRKHSLLFDIESCLYSLDLKYRRVQRKKRFKNLFRKKQ